MLGAGRAERDHAGKLATEDRTMVLLPFSQAAA